MPNEPQQAGDIEKLILSLLRRLDDVEKWQATAQGQQGISVTGNVFTGPKPTLPYTPPQPANPVNPYELGTTAKGSTDPATPSVPPALDGPMTDTGITGVQPLNISSAKTDGYKLQVMTRPKLTNTGSGVMDLLFFVRDLVWMEDGRIYEADVEKCVGYATLAGSGSGSGTV